MPFLHRDGHGDGPVHRYGGTNSDTITVTITVTNVDEAPELTGMDSVRVAENTADTTADTTTVGTTYMVTDDEDGTPTYP